ncbi:MAG: DUF819 family protein [Prolixibacteraceae bacterium]
MNILVPILLISFYLAFPVLIIYLTHISVMVRKIGAVVLAYAMGLILGNSGILPAPSPELRNLLGGRSAMPANELLTYINQGIISQTDFFANQIAKTQDLLITIVIPLSIPLLLFSMDIRRWLKFLKGAMLSMVLGIISLILVIFSCYFVFRDKIPELWKVSGMLVGIYTGGTPNLAAIGTALQVDPAIFVLTHTYEMVAGAICLVFLLTAAQRVFNLFLPHLHEHERPFSLTEMVKQSDGVDNYLGMLNRKGLIGLSKALGLAGLIFAAGGMLSLLVPLQAQMLTVVLTITTLGLLFSTIKRVSRIEKTFQAGMYFVIVFSLVVASMGDLRGMFNADFLSLFLLVTFTVFGAIAVHVFLAWIFRLDTDTTIIAITALTYSPPFVPVVAGALRNRDVIISGLTIGILGYAIGNYLGLSVAYILKGF